MQASVGEMSKSIAGKEAGTSVDCREEQAVRYAMG